MEALAIQRPPVRLDYSVSDISAGWVAPHTNDHAVLLCVRTGAITVDADSTRTRVCAGHGMWIPAGVEHAVDVERGTLCHAVAALMPKRSQLLSSPKAVSIPVAWQDWLVYKSDFGMTIDNGPLLELAAGTIQFEGTTATLPQLPVLRATEAQRVAQHLLRSPGELAGIDEFAAGQNISAKTLQRQFLHDTGMTFSEWRTRLRIIAAASHIAAGYPIGVARCRVGFETPAGFTRAFRRHLAISPREYLRQLRDTSPPCDDSAVSALVEADLPPAPPPIPSFSGPWRVNDCHVLLWIYRGTATIRIGTHDWHLAAGQAIWVPAGVSHRVEIDEDSILRPLGNRYGRTGISIEDLQVFTFPSGAETYLLHVSVVEYGRFRSTDPPRVTDDLFQMQFMTGHTSSRNVDDDNTLSGAVGEIATALWRKPADSRSLTAWAAAVGISPDDLSAEFLSQTGTTFPRWRSQLRMNLARNMLWQGERPSLVARKLGYSSPSTFTRVFTSAHGVPPREFVPEGH